jgi:hypothetical protein
MIIMFLYLGACQELVAYNRRELKMYLTKARQRLELEVELD